jgi:murein DD-endopeptidase MepM/ murein hydrolase activator NlpD
VAALSAAVLLLCTAGPVAAQDPPVTDPPEETSTTSTTTTSSTTTTVPSDSTTSTSTSTTVPELPAEAEQPVDAGDHHSSDGPPPPGPWDRAPIGNETLALLGSQRAEGVARLDAANAAMVAATERVAAAEAALGELSDAERDAAQRYAVTRERFARRVAAAYVVGSPDTVRLPVSDDVGAEANRVVLPGAVSESDRALAETYRRQRDELSARMVAAADDVSAAKLSRDAAAAAVTAAEEFLEVVDSEIATAPASIAGFVFPVAGPHNFISSFGFCRDGCARSHQGNDIFAATGTPVVAVEDGWVERIGSNRLGGLVVWTRGRSGYRYYYAHLDGYADGLVAGQEIAAGTLVGYVGNTGNAITTPPHLHFEIRPGMGPAIDPYQILKSAPVLTTEQIRLPTTTSTTAPPAMGGP